MHAVLSLVAVEAGISIVPASMSVVRAAEIAYHPLNGLDAKFDIVTCRRAAHSSPALQALLATLHDTL